MNRVTLLDSPSGVTEVEVDVVAEAVPSSSGTDRTSGSGSIWTGQPWMRITTPSISTLGRTPRTDSPSPATQARNDPSRSLNDLPEVRVARWAR